MLFRSKVNGTPVVVTSIGFKRRPFYAPLLERDLRIVPVFDFDPSAISTAGIPPYPSAMVWFEIGLNRTVKSGIDLQGWRLPPCRRG